jgi:hypothetical protein
MRPTITTADWLRRAAEAWEQADDTDDPKVRAARLTIAEGCQRLARHAALRSCSEQDSSTVAALGHRETMDRSHKNAAHRCAVASRTHPRLLIARVLRVVAAWLTTPFLLLAALVIGCWLSVLGIKRPHDG